MSAPSYVLITPAHNEEAYVEELIASVASQTIRPQKWVIVNDGSTDDTRRRVEAFSTKHDFIQLLNVTRTGGHNFGKKVLAFNRGLEAVQGLNYDFIGNLDADITVGPNYFESVLRAFEANARLGIAGGAVFSNTQGKFVNQNASLDSVAGAVQLFRRECFEEIGGIPLLEYGGEDGSAEIKARMKGWKVEQLPNLHAHEHRQTGTARSGLWLSKFREGRRFYSMGYGFAFYAMRCLYRSKEPPIILGSMMAFAGYLRCVFQREPKGISAELERFLRAEKRSKLKRLAFFNRRDFSRHKAVGRVPSVRARLGKTV